MPDLYKDSHVVWNIDDGLLMTYLEFLRKTFGWLSEQGNDIFHSSSLSYSNWHDIKDRFRLIKRDLKLNCPLIYLYQRVVQCGIRNLMMYVSDGIKEGHNLEAKD